MNLIGKLDLKEAFHQTEIHLLSKKNFLRNISLIIILIGTFSIGFSKTFFLDYSDLFYGKFIWLNSLNITISTFLIFLGSLLFLIKKRTQIQLSKPTVILIISVITLLTIKNDPNIFNFLSLILFILACNYFNKKEIKLITIAFLSAIFIQILIATFQFLSQSSTNLNLLNFLGEPRINEETKGISKVNFLDNVFFRPYGTLNHPNLLAGTILISLFLSKNLYPKFKYIHYLGILISLSISTYLSTIILNLKKISKTLTLFLLAVILIGLIKLIDPSYQGVTDRIFQLNSIFNWNPGLLELIIGNESKLLNIQNYKILPWENQPIHNHYIYTLIQYGISGLSILLYLSYKIFQKNKLIFLSILPILLLDHYFLTLANGILLTGFIYLSIFKKSTITS